MTVGATGDSDLEWLGACGGTSFLLSVPSQPGGGLTDQWCLDWVGGLSVFVEAAHGAGLPGVLTFWRQALGCDWSSVPWGDRDILIS